jgi:hypothetical protein
VNREFLIIEGPSMGNPKVAIVASFIALVFILIVAFLPSSKTGITASVQDASPAETKSK